MPRTAAKATRRKPQPSTGDDVESALAWLKRHSTKRTREGMARYGIPSDNALGVSVGDIHSLAKRLGRNHQLAAALWDTGIYEARMLAAFVDEPGRVTPAQMDRWCRDFDSWAICDTTCFHLFDRTPVAWEKAPMVFLTARVRQACRLCADGFPGRALQSHSWPAIPDFPASKETSCRWVGKDALRELASPKVGSRLART